jgi:hypothetical protein
MQTYDNDTQEPVEATAVNAEMLPALMRAEIDIQIATARAFPRSVAKFIKEARELVTIDEDMAEACIYSLPRGKENGKPKFVTGPSVRFAEIIQQTFGNNRAGARIIATDKDTITAQGVYHDLEKNTQVTKEASRRIIDKYGKRYNADMIMVTGNAAISIAHRNAVLAGVPQAFWAPVYEAAKMCAVGDVTTLSVRRANAIAWFGKAGITPEALFAKLGVEGIEDIGIEQLETLVGIKTAIRRGDYTVDSAFAEPAPDSKASVSDLAARVAAATGKKAEKPASKEPQKDPDTGEILPADLQ